MRKVVIIGFVFLLFVVVWNILKISKNPPANNSKAEPTQEEKSVFQEFTAGFEITTNGTKRIFTSPMYHNLSNDVYITAKDSSVVYIKKPNIAWQDFFDTLPMKLTKECLTTGTKQTFCTDSSGKLQFFINEQEIPRALEKEINPNDYLKVIYQ